MTSHDPNRQWAFVDPRGPKRPRAHPLVNDETEEILEDALVHLVMLRDLGWGDGMAVLHALTSLALQLRLRVPDAATRAIDQGYSWSEVAEQLDISPAAARRRYRHNLRTPMAD